MFKCEYCEKSFNSKRSLASHRNHHNQKYKERALEGSKALQSEKAINNRNKQYEKQKYDNWKQKTLNNCIICNKGLSYPEIKICSSQKCYKIYRSEANRRVHSEETKDKIREGLKSQYRTEKKCLNCENVFESTKQIEKYCQECYAEIRSKPRVVSEETKKKISDGLKKAFKEGRHHGNQYRNRQNPSYLEQSFLDYLKEYYPDVKYEFNKPVKFSDEDGNYTHCYYPDFYFPKTNEIIELDGKQHELTREYDAMRDQALIQKLNCKIYRIDYDDYFSCKKKDMIDFILMNNQE